MLFSILISIEVASVFYLARILHRLRNLSFVVLYSLISLNPLSGGEAWKDVKVGDIQVPARPVPVGKVDHRNGLSLVLVAEESREILATEPKLDSSLKQYMGPSAVKLHCRVKEVFAGDSLLADKEVTASIIDLRSKSIVGHAEISKHIPNPTDEGIWLVKEVDGSLICISAELLGVRFPIYSSGVQNEMIVKGRKCDFSKMKDFTQRVRLTHQAIESSSQSLKDLMELARGDNLYMALWAVSMLCRTEAESRDALLMDLCLANDVPPFAQTIADDYLRSADPSWNNSDRRKRMVEAWLGKDLSVYSQVFGGYLAISNDPPILRGYDREVLIEQIRQEKSRRVPGGKADKAFQYAIRYLESSK